MPTRVTIDALAAWLKEREDFILIGHVSPDGDATGSCMAAMLALRALGKRAFVCLPGGVAKMYARYPMADEILKPEDVLPFAPKTAFVLDTSEEFRMGAARELFNGCADRAALDHHATNPGFGDVWSLDGDSAATGELVLALIHALGVTLTKDMALWLYIAISTDCGQFGFSNTRPSTMNAAAELLETGIDIARLTRELYNTRSCARTKLLGRVLSVLEVSADGRMAWSRMTKAMLEETGALPEDKEGVVNFLLEIEGVEFAALAEERDGGIKFSLRSKEWLDVATEVAKPFGGGGHSRAAGCTLDSSLDEALKQVLAQAEKALAQH